MCTELELNNAIEIAEEQRYKKLKENCDLIVELLKDTTAKNMVETLAEYLIKQRKIAYNAGYQEGHDDASGVN